MDLFANMLTAVWSASIGCEACARKAKLASSCTSTTYDECQNAPTTRERRHARTATTAYTSTLIPKQNDLRAHTTTAGFARSVHTARSSTARRRRYARSTCVVSVLQVHNVRMVPTQGSRQTSRSQMCASKRVLRSSRQKS